jgi:hypothetical protein
MKKFLMAQACALLLAVGVPAAGGDLGGVVIAPPTGDDWTLVQANSQSLVWMKRTGDPDITFGVALLTRPITTDFATRADFADWVRRAAETNPDPDRFHLLKNDVLAGQDVDDNCVRYHRVIEDRSAGEGPDTALRLEVTGVACRHPEEPMRYFDAQYSGRMPLPAHLPQALTEEGTSFLDSLGFSGVPEDGDWSLAEGEPARTQREET